MYIQNYESWASSLCMKSLAKYRKARYCSSDGKDVLVHIKYRAEKLLGRDSTLSVNVGTSTVYTSSKLF